MSPKWKLKQINYMTSTVKKRMEEEKEKERKWEMVWYHVKNWFCQLLSFNDRILLFLAFLSAIDIRHFSEA